MSGKFVSGQSSAKKSGNKGSAASAKAAQSARTAGAGRLPAKFAASVALPKLFALSQNQLALLFKG